MRRIRLVLPLDGDQDRVRGGGETAVIVAIAQVRNQGVLENVLRLEVGESAFEAVAHFEAQRAVGDEEEEHDAVVLLRPPHPPGLGNPLGVLLEDLAFGQLGEDRDQDL